MGALRDKVATNRYVKDLNEAKLLQDEASFYISFDTHNPHTEIFKTRIKEIYAGDIYKYRRFFRAFAGQIMPSIELCETIFSQVFRVWDSGDPVNEVNFKNTDLNDEALSYVESFNNWWMYDFWEGFKHQFCSFIVVDLPVIQLGERPSPYPFILDVSDVIFIDFKKNKIKEIIFRSIEKNENDEKDREYWYWYSDTFYSKYLIDGDKETLLFNNPHNLKRCPVHKLWNEKLNKTSKILAKGLLTPNYEDLFRYIVKSVESFKADLLYLNPLKQTPKVSCGYNSENDKEYRYKTEFGQTECNGGYLYTIDGKRPVVENGQRVLCPACGTQRHASGGAGNEIVIDLDTQAVKDGKVNISSELVKYITPDIDGIKEQYSRVTELGDRIVKHCVGSDDQPTKSALNELQQHAIFESKESVLKRMSIGISNIKTDVNRDMFELRYGDQFISNNFNQGTKFYLHTVEDLLDIRLKSKDPIQKRQIDEQILDVKYRNNRKKLDEEKLLYKLLPYNTLTDEEFFIRVDNGKIIDSDAINLRMQFSNAIELFESEFGSIIEFFTYKFEQNITEIKRLEIIRSFLMQKITNNVQNQVS